MARIWDRTYLLVTKYFFSLDILTETIEVRELNSTTLQPADDGLALLGA